MLGIVAALEMECRWIGAPEPLVELSGVGDARAENAAHRLVDRGARALVSWGVAGGLDPDLAPGTVVLPDAVVHTDGSSQEVDLAWRDRLMERVSGQVVTSTSSLYHASSVITSPDEKRAVYERVGAGAVDMESAAVAAVASEMGIPFVVVRVVVDAAGVRLPEVALTMCDEGGRLKKSACAGSFFSPASGAGC